MEGINFIGAAVTFNTLRSEFADSWKEFDCIMDAPEYAHMGSMLNTVDANGKIRAYPRFWNVSDDQ